MYHSLIKVDQGHHTP